MATQKFDGDTTIENLTVTGTTTATGAQTIGGNLSVTGTTTSGGALTVTTGGATVTAGGLTVTAGGANITGDSTINGVLSLGATPITFTDNTTKVTVNKTVEVAGSVLATGAFSGTHVVETTSKATVTDTTYTVAEGVHVVECVSTGAGGPYAITLGANNAVNHVVVVRCSAYDTSSFTIASAEGTTTLDAANENATFIYDGAAWICTGFVGTTGPA